VSPDRWLVLLGALLFVVSLFMPAIEGSGFPTQSGSDVLRQGAAGWRDGVVAWYANPVLGLTLALTLMRRYRLALVAAALGLLLAFSSYAAAPVAESAGRSVPAFGFAVGFYLWLLAFAAAAAAPLVGIYKVSGRADRR
jgi:hypothetical protein